MKLVELELDHKKIKSVVETLERENIILKKKVEQLEKENNYFKKVMMIDEYADLQNAEIDLENWEHDIRAQIENVIDLRNYLKAISENLDSERRVSRVTRDNADSLADLVDSALSGIEMELENE